METNECAVWWWRYGAVEVELCEDEHEAARFALRLSDSEQGAVAGVQFSDGRYVDRDQWEAYETEDRRRMEESMAAYRREQENPTPRPPLREIVPPFETRSGQTAEVLAEDYRPWLGRLAVFSRDVVDK